MRAVILLVGLSALIAMANACMYNNRWYYPGITRINGRSCECKWNNVMTCMCRINGFDLSPGKYMVNGQSCTCRSNGMHGCMSTSSLRSRALGGQEQGCDIDGNRYAAGDHEVDDDLCKCQANGDYMCYPKNFPGQPEGANDQGPGPQRDQGAGPQRDQGAQKEERLAERLLQMLKGIN